MAIDRESAQVAERIALVAAATRLCVFEGLLDFSGHISARLPGADAFLIQSGQASRSDLRPSDILVVDGDGTVLSGDGKPPLEVALHLGIMRARPDVEAVLHSHLAEAVSFTLMEDTPVHILRPAASRWVGGIPLHGFPASINTPAHAADLAATLGPRNAALLRAHGLVLCAESIKALFMDAVYFLENLRTNMLLLQSGRKAVPLTEAEMDLIETPRAFNVDKVWSHYSKRAQAAGIAGE